MKRNSINLHKGSFLLVFVLCLTNILVGVALTNNDTTPSTKDAPITGDMEINNPIVIYYGDFPTVIGDYIYFWYNSRIGICNFTDGQVGNYIDDEYRGTENIRAVTHIGDRLFILDNQNVDPDKLIFIQKSPAGYHLENIASKQLNSNYIDMSVAEIGNDILAFCNDGTNIDVFNCTIAHETSEIMSYNNDNLFNLTGSSQQFSSIIVEDDILHVATVNEGANTRGLASFNVSNITQPKLISNFDGLEYLAACKTITIESSRAYVTHQNNKVDVYYRSEKGFTGIIGGLSQAVEYEDSLIDNFKLYALGTTYMTVFDISDVNNVSTIETFDFKDNKCDRTYDEISNYYSTIFLMREDYTEEKDELIAVLDSSVAGATEFIAFIGFESTTSSIALPWLEIMLPALVFIELVGFTLAKRRKRKL